MMIRRLVLFVSAAIILVSTIAGGGIYWLFRGDGARLALERQATRWLGQPITIRNATVHIFPRPAIWLQGVRVGDPARIVLADVQLSTGLRPLLARRIEDADIIVSNSRIDMPVPFAMPVAAPGSTDLQDQGGVRLVSVRAITLRNVTIASHGRQITVSAESSLSAAHLNLDRFTASSGGTSLQASGLVQLTPRLDAQLRVVANRLDVDDLVALADAFSPRTARQTATVAGPGLPGRVVARISSETARAGGVDVRQFAATLVAQGNRITLSPASFQLFGGSYQGVLDLDSEITALRATVRAQISGIDVAQLAAFGGVPDTISGTLSGAGTFNGRGATIGDALAAAAGEGTVSITNGEVKRLGLVRTVILFFGRAPTATPSTDHFDRIDVSFALVRRVLAASAFSLHSPDVDLVGQGTLAIPAKSLDGHMDLSLSEALSAQAGTDLLRFTRDGNRVLIPATLGGTLDSPRVSIDAGAAARRGLRNEVERRLKDVLGGLKPAPPD
jgi:hypothetical protein